MAKKKATTKKSTTAPKSATLSDIYNQVAVLANKRGVKLNVAETKHILACFFDVLENYKPVEAFEFVTKGLKRAGTRRR
ncbi:hypothetical protein [Aureliella helgolandensis]|uniref:Uncharacterized protein n=1 Tax=Aureliella helgolandensis TaxID=2527968 RepID=A0A518G7P9_9BACT|nr:hypothetical protein [Aureliella helgolandensis]QDV24608.1 hypothetical protein Q31a_29280 [Aureliella helgolandensis]